jgi:anti-sigma factor RsiW
MCDDSARLVALLDGELASDEQVNLERHVRECVECRARLEKYERVSKTLNEYCLRLTDSQASARLSRLPAILSVAGPAVLAAILFVALLRSHSHPALTPSPRIAAPSRSAAVSEPPLVPVQVAHRRHKPSLVPTQTASALPPEPAIRIAIPAESMFPPGAVPEGVSFSADVSLGPDGWAQQVRLRPHLATFEGRGIEP